MVRETVCHKAFIVMMRFRCGPSSSHLSIPVGQTQSVDHPPPSGRTVDLPLTQQLTSLLSPRQYILAAYTSIPHLRCLPSMASHQCHPCWNWFNLPSWGLSDLTQADHFPSPLLHHSCMVCGAILAVYDLMMVLSFVRYTDQSVLI